MGAPRPARPAAAAPPAAQHPSPLPVMTLLLGSAVLAALGVIVLARGHVPALGWTVLGVGVLGALWGVVLAVRNVQTSRRIARAEAAARRTSEREPAPLDDV